MEEISVLLVSSKLPPEYTGSGLRIINMYRRLLQHYRLKVTAICGSVEFSKDEAYRLDGIMIRRFNNSMLPYHKIIIENNRLLRKIKLNLKVMLEGIRFLPQFLSQRYDVIHIVGKNYLTAVGTSLAYIFRKPLILEYVNCDRPKEFNFAHEPGILKKFIRSSPYKSKKTILIAISPFIKQNLRKFGLRNIWLRPNPISENKFRFYAQEEKKSLRQRQGNFSNDDIVLCYIAKWRPSKNHIFLLELLKSLPDRFKLILGGPVAEGGPYYDRDRALVKAARDFIAQHALSDRVMFFEGFKENIAELMALSDVYLFPTLEEALGTPLLEAIAIGRPVVANNLSEVWGWIAERFSSVFLTPLSQSEWTTSIRKALEIKEEVLKELSGRMLDFSSSKIIDKKYYLLLKGLKENKYNSEEIIRSIQ